MKASGWNLLKAIISIFSVLINIATTGSWIYLSQKHAAFEDAQAAYQDLWKMNPRWEIGLAIILTIFSIIYFARTSGIWSKIALVLQILFFFWFSWSLL